MNKTLLLFSLITFKLLALSLSFPESKSRVEFLAIGQPSSLKIKGQLTEETKLKGGLEIKEGKVMGRVTLPLAGFDTGIELRNRHIKEKYLEIEKYPETTVNLHPLVVATSTKEGGIYSGPFTGTLVLHGQEKPIQGELNLHNKAGKLAGSLKFEIKLSDFAIEIPTYMGITVSKEVKVNAEFGEG